LEVFLLNVAQAMAAGVDEAAGGEYTGVSTSSSAARPTVEAAKAKSGQTDNRSVSGQLFSAEYFTLKSVAGRPANTRTADRRRVVRTASLTVSLVDQAEGNEFTENARSNHQQTLLGCALCAAQGTDDCKAPA
jgi:hypothetical protein